MPSSGRVIPPPTDLTLPRAGVPTLRAALSAALKRLAQDLGRLPLASLSPDARATLTHVLRATKAELAREPGRVFGVLRRPNVGAALRVLRERADDAIARQLAATLAVELAAAQTRGEVVRRLLRDAGLLRHALRAASAEEDVRGMLEDVPRDAYGVLRRGQPRHRAAPQPLPNNQC